MVTKVDKIKQLITEKGDGALLYLKYLNATFDDVYQAYNELGQPLPIISLKNKSGVITSGGWGNGYVRIPEGHPFYGKEYNEIDVSVHGGLTFSEHVTITDGDVLPEGFWIGFDTFHHGDDSIYWTERRVLEETIHLFSQVYGLSN